MTGQFGLARFAEFPFFQILQDFPRALQHGVGQARQPRDLDSIALVGRAGRDLAQEHHAVAPLAHEHVEVLHAGHGQHQIGELVIVRREEGLRLHARLVVQVFGHGPRDADAVEGARPPADFVQHHEAARGRAVQDARGLLHLHEEGAAAPREVVAGAHAGEHAIHDADLGLGGGHEGTHLRHDDDQRDLPDVGGFARHVGAGQDDQLVPVGVQPRVVGHEAIRARQRLDHGMTPVADDERGAVGDPRLHIAQMHRAVGERCEHVKLRQRRGGNLQRPGMLRDLGAQFLEQFALEGDRALLRAQDAVLVLLELLGDEPFRVRHRLLADVFRRCGRELGAGDFDVVAEDFVVADLERLDARALLFGGLEPGDPVAALRRGVAQFIQLGMIARADHAALADGRRRLVHHGPLDRLPQRRQGLDGRGQRFQPGIAELRRERFELRQILQRAPHPAQVAGVSGTGAQSRHHALEVAQLTQQLAQPLARGGSVHEPVHGGQPGADRFGFGQRSQQPVAHAARAHGGAGHIQHADQRRLAAARAITGQFEIRCRGLVQRQKSAGGMRLDAADVADIPAQIARHVIERRARRTHAQRRGFERVSVERHHLEVPGQHLARRVGKEAPVLDARHRHARGRRGQRALGHGVGDQDFGGAPARDDFRRGLQPRAVFHPERARGQLQPRDADAALARIQRAQEVARGRFEDGFLHRRARRDDPRDFPRHEPLGLGGILDLVADRDLASRAQEASDVVLRRVIRHAAHGHGLAAGQRDIEQAGGFPGVIEKHLVEIAQPEEKNRIRRQAGAQPPVLGHHGGEWIAHRRGTVVPQTAAPARAGRRMPIAVTCVRASSF